MKDRYIMKLLGNYNLKHYQEDINNECEIANRFNNLFNKLQVGPPNLQSWTK